MKTLTVIAITLITLAGGCKNQEKVVETAPGTETTPDVVDVVEEEPTMPVAEDLVEAMENDMEHPIPSSHKMGGVNKADSLVFSIVRTPCFGTCKAYSINVYRSGYATYIGNSNVEKIGKHQAWIGQDTIVNLVNEAYRSGFFKLEDKYDAPVTDLPSLVIHVVANDKDKTVIGRVGTPAKMKNFAKMADELLLPVAWKPVVGQN